MKVWALGCFGVGHTEDGTIPFQRLVDERPVGYSVHPVLDAKLLVKRDLVQRSRLTVTAQVEQPDQGLGRGTSMG